MHPDILRRDEPMSRLSRAVMALRCLSVAGCAVSPTARPASSAAATESASPPSPIGAFPAISEAPLSDQVRAVLQAALEMPVEGGLVQAIAASVRVPGVGGWSGVAGDDGSGESTSVDAQFSIASVTKTVVAAQVLAFAEDGRIDLDQPISGYLPPDLGIDTNDASVRDMLAMRSGLAQIPDALLRQLLAEDPARPWSLDEMAPFLPGPVDAPGAVVSYNSVNYALLGAAIERVSGRSPEHGASSWGAGGQRPGSAHLPG